VFVIDGSQREIVTTVDSCLPGTSYRPSHIYPISTIASDGRRIALPAFLGDGAEENVRWGLMIFDLDTARVTLVLEGPTWCNLHPQYCRAKERPHDVMVQENHGNVCTASGEITTLVSGKGADIHLIRDDGSNMRSFPWGRDGHEFCQGHQCWRGTGTTAITSTATNDGRGNELIESPEAPFADHAGLLNPHGRRNVLSRDFEKPRFSHFATDRAGQRFISDAHGKDGNWSIYTARFSSNENDPLENWRFVLDTRSSAKAHPHPFLSPDGSKGFFNSDESGVLQAYMITGI